MVFEFYFSLLLYVADMQLFTLKCFQILFLVRPFWTNILIIVIQSQSLTKSALMELERLQDILFTRLSESRFVILCWALFLMVGLGHPPLNLHRGSYCSIYPCSLEKNVRTNYFAQQIPINKARRKVKFFNLQTCFVFPF